MKLAHLRLKEAEILLKKRKYAGAYYIVGYSIECALKACIAKQTKKNEFPDRAKVNDSYTHNLKKLLHLTGLQSKMDQEDKDGTPVGRNWAYITQWNEESRYRTDITRKVAKDMIDAISDEITGVLKWLEKQC
ncbi:MAG: HEPN domain-containing protein [Bacteroidetes bacterium]|nr:HEPN domain-containing protein [Bacteroidota bacterium]